MDSTNEINSYQKVYEALSPYINEFKNYHQRGTSVIRCRLMLQFLNNPHKNFKVIHIAGTSGKSSTAYYLAALLSLSQEKVGLTVSPHIYKITERVQINNKPLSDQIFFKELTIFLKKMSKSPIIPTYYEFMFLFSMWEFNRQKITYVVVETGMGGLYDSSNVLDHKNKICVITDIGFDHMDFLGNTLDAISRQKVGIVHQQNHLIIYRQSSEIMKPIMEWTKAKAATVQIINDSNILVNSLPDYHRRNWFLAFNAYLYIQKREHWNEVDQTLINNTQKIGIPGRMEIIKYKNKTIIMDGAHNEQKMETLINSYKAKFNNTKPIVIIAIKKGKEYKKIVTSLLTLSNNFIITSLHDPFIKSIEPEVLRKEFIKHSGVEVRLSSDLNHALEIASKMNEKNIIVTGSLYLMAEFHPIT